jgi:hypothetical protein
VDVESAAAVPENLLEVKILAHSPDPLNQELTEGENGGGLQAVGFCAGFFCLVGWVLFCFVLSFWF